MALQITVAGTDRTKLIIPESLRISQVITQKVDECAFRVNKFGSRTFYPTIGNEVVVTKDGTKVFGGRIVQIQEKYDALDYIGYEVQCLDYGRDLDKRLVVETYENQTIDAIVADLRSKGYIPSYITISNVNAPVTVKYIAFNYETTTQCLKRLVELVSYDWYVDYDKDLHLFAKEANAAPFELSDTNGKYIYDSLLIRKDISQLRNTIYVRGGEYKGDSFTVEVIGDGTQRIFDTKYRFADLSVMVTGQLKSIGIDFIDQESQYDALYNFQEKTLKFREDRKPTGATKWWGQPYIPVIVKLRDNSSIDYFSAAEGNDGIHEFKVIDPSIKSKEGARQRARAELLAYAATVSEGEFQTYTDGLRAGQRIHVQSTLRGVDAYFVINKLEIRAFGQAGDLVYKVQLVSTKTFDMIDLLQKLLTDKDRDIKISDDDVLDEIESLDEIIQTVETITVTSETPPFQWGPGGVPQLRWNLGEWG